ncbi:MAG: hypothetical protein NVV83_01560 [Afipia sp.]|nr:hypothetical protein [Afipia sp.]
MKLKGTPKSKYTEEGTRLAEANARARASLIIRNRIADVLLEEGEPELAERARAGEMSFVPRKLPNGDVADNYADYATRKVQYDDLRATGKTTNEAKAIAFKDVDATTTDKILKGEWRQVRERVAQMKKERDNTQSL